MLCYFDSVLSQDEILFPALCCQYFFHLLITSIRWRRLRRLGFLFHWVSWWRFASFYSFWIRFFQRWPPSQEGGGFIILDRKCLRLSKTFQE